ncbi:anaerobic ribonucleoside-triphosphate reductase activating protein [Candidatus Micrarchaeota archaeon]|nr:anaerobic ribonucleoside-triphosphate reductase activating protein [Candidatus Micrarchaeota archaeon]MBU1930943.1 anaerobic ribonucleoside-triphosphate reductase activating protein [Candidatus Micrarchaeota archaeon]
MRELDIAGFIPKSVVDWRGKVSSVVFVPGCNFACDYCFSHQLISKPDSLPKIHVSTVLDSLSNRQNNIKAVVISGGEPTLHGHRLIRFLEEVQARGLLTRIETNGSNPFMIRFLIENELLDSVVLDVKAPLYSKRYAETVNKTAVLSKVKRSMYLVMDSGIDYEFRTVVIPGKTSLRDIQSIARSIRGAKRFVLQQFVPFSGTLNPKFESISATSYDQLIEFAQKVIGIQEVRIKTEKGEETINQLSRIHQPR